MYFKKPQLEIIMFRKIKIKIATNSGKKKRYKKMNDIETYLRIKKITWRDKNPEWSTHIAWSQINIHHF